MIRSSVFSHRRRATSGRRRGRSAGTIWLVAVNVTAVLVTGGVLLPRLVDVPSATWGVQPARALAGPTAGAAGTASASAPTGARPATPSVASDPAESVARLRGPFPTEGTGRFAFAGAGAGVVGRSGPVRRYRVAVERGSGEDVDAFVAVVDRTLGDSRSWIGNGGVRLERVAGARDHDFTIYLATRETAGQMCLDGGVDIRVGGKPYTSCRVGGRVVINLDRWRGSARPFLERNVPLADYRQYVINHEVGHALGQGHQRCPRPGRPAPVMAQQTLRLDGCLPYAWPRRDGRAYRGPSV